MARLLVVVLIAQAACVSAPPGTRAVVGVRPMQCLERCSETSRGRSCELSCEPQLAAVHWEPDCRMQCADAALDQRASCITRCEQPPRRCGNASPERGPLFRAAVVALAIVGFSATGALAVHQAVDR